jgi:hypothetical protein
LCGPWPNRPAASAGRTCGAAMRACSHVLGGDSGVAVTTHQRCSIGNHTGTVDGLRWDDEWQKEKGLGGVTGTCVGDRQRRTAGFGGFTWLQALTQQPRRRRDSSWLLHRWHRRLLRRRDGGDQKRTAACAASVGLMTKNGDARQRPSRQALTRRGRRRC